MAEKNKRNQPRHYGMGLRFDPYDARDHYFIETPMILPLTIDNREEATAVRDQGKEGSCTGHALVAAAEILYWRKLGRPPDFSERWAYEKAKIHDEWPGTDYEGSSLRGAVKGWSKEGICEEKYWPYKPGKKGRVKKGGKDNASSYPLLKYERCLGLEKMKQAIHHRGVIIVGAMVHQGWLEAPGCEEIPFSSDYELIGGHAIALVGYNDNRQIFWVKNSWGYDWGVEGFAGLTYQDALCNIQDAWSMVIED